MKSALREYKNAIPSAPKLLVNDKAAKLLASSIFRQLQDEGCAPRDIISVSSQLIDLVTAEILKAEATRIS